MKKPEKPVVGQVLYSLNVGNDARHGTEQILKKGEVVKVGRKYFSVKYSSWKPTQYSLENWRERTAYSPSSKLYINPQEWEDEKEVASICIQLAKVFEYGCNRNGLSLETLRKINQLVSEESEGS